MADQLILFTETSLIPFSDALHVALRRASVLTVAPEEKHQPTRNQI